MSEPKRARHRKMNWEVWAACLGLLSMVVASIGLWIVEQRPQFESQPDWHLVNTHVVWMDPDGTCLGATHDYTCDDPPPGPYRVGWRLPSGSGGWTVSFMPGAHWSSEDE